MVTPLFQSKNRPSKRPKHGNAGLWFDKYFDQWPATGWKLGDGKSQWLQDFAGDHAGDRAGENALLTEATTRVAELVQRMGGRLRVYQTTSRFVTGLGRSHPVKNGFAWHPSLGVPYLPGSSVKGLLHAWARQEKEGADDTAWQTLFGQPDAVGALCFLDALPLSAVRLEVDVMTPHYAGWKADGPPEDLPGDWRAPKPVPFLTVAAKQRFAFAILPRAGGDATALDQAAGWLDDALEWLGAGAKTAVGYGRMARDATREEALRKEVRAALRKREEALRKRLELAQASPLQRRLIALAEGSNKADYQAWIEAAKAGEWADDPAAQREVLATIEERMRAQKVWKPKEGKVKKNNAAQKWTRWAQEMQQSAAQDQGQGET